MSIKTIARGLVVACCAALGFNAWAETIACWNGDLDVGSTKGGLTISNLSSALYPEGAMKLTKVDSGTSNPKGIYLTTADGEPLVKDTVTFIFRYSGYDSSNANNAVLAADMGTAEATHILQVFTQNAEHKVNVGYNAAAGQGMALSNLTIPSEGMIAVMMSNVSGIRVLVATKNEDGTYSAFNKNGCQYSSAKYGTVFKSFMIASSDKNTGSYHRPGMTVDGIAVLDEVIDNGFTYAFPTEATYVKGSLNGYIDKNTAQTFIPNATLAEIKSGTIKAKINGGNITSGFKNQVIRPLFVTEVMDGEAISKVTMQFQLKESESMAKVVLAECTQEGDNVVIKATEAKHSTVSNAYGTDATGWTGGGTVVTSDTAAGYGIHNLTFAVPYKPIYAVETSKTYAELNVEAPAAGDKAAIYVSKDAVLTFANETIPTGVDFIAEDATAGIKVAGTIPAALFSTAKLTIAGEAQITSDTAITGENFSLDNGSVVTDNKAIQLGANGIKIAASGESSIAKLWVGTSNNGITATADVATDSQLTIGNIVNNYSHTIVKDGDGVLKVTNNVSNKQVKYQLKAGSIVGKAAQTSITVHSSVSGMVIVESEPDAEGYTTYTLGLAPRTEPTTIYVKNTEHNQFQTADGDSINMIAGDTVSFKAGVYPDNSRWNILVDEALAGHTVVIDFAEGSTASQATINNEDLTGKHVTITAGTVVFFREATMTVGADTVVDGDGAIHFENDTILVNGTATISATLTTKSGCTGTIKIAEGGELTTAEITNESITLTTEVTGKKVSYDEENGKYVLVAKSATELFLEGIAAGGTVALTDSITVGEWIVVDKAVTIDLAGHTITAAETFTGDAVIAIKHGGALTLKDSATGGTVDGSAVMCGIKMTQNASDTDTTAGDAILVIEGGVVIGKNFGISGNGNRAGTQVTVSGGTVKAVMDDDGIGIYQPQLGSLTISGGTIEGTTFGVYAKSGSVSISGGTIKSTATEIVVPTVSNNGTNGKGYALVLEKLAAGEGGYANNLTADVTGGTFEAPTAILSWARTSSIRLTKFVADEVVLIEGEQTPSAADIMKSYTPQPTMPEAITGGSTEQQTAYQTWATANGVSGSTTSDLAAAFAIIPEATDLETEEAILAAAQEEIVDILATIDLTQITTAAFTLDDYPNATFKFVEASLGEGVTTTANLFRLTVEFKADTAE